MPSFQKYISNTPFGNLKSLIDSVNTHIESFEKSIEEKVRNDFNAKSVHTLKKMILRDRATLGDYMKSMQDAINEVGNLYKSCLSLGKFTVDIEKKSREFKDQLGSISQSVDPLTNSLSSHENQVISLLEKIGSSNHDHEQILGKFGEIRSLIIPKLDIILISIHDAQNALKVDELEDLKTVEA